MKKLILILMSVFIILSVYGCAAESQEPEGIDEFSNILYFDYDLLVFNVRSNIDVLYGTPNPVDDFMILKTVCLEETLTSEQESAYRHILEHMVTLSETNNIPIPTILSYDSSVLSDALESLDLDVTLNDIVIFNELKVIGDEFIQTPYLSRYEYVAARLNRPLTTIENVYIGYLQVLYEEVRDHDSSYMLFEHSATFFQETLESYGRTFTEEESTDLIDAYNFILQFR